MGEQRKNNTDNWLKELFRRRVVQTVALYIAIAWGATEIFVTVQEVQGWPEWTARLVVAVFITGFPVALILAWARDIRGRGLRTAVHVVAVTIFAAGSWLVYQQGHPPGPPFASLVVVPFADLSADGNQKWFVDGLSHELRSTLAQLQGLLVIAETSADVFRGRATDLDAIGVDLNVRHVLEGAVRRDHDQLRVTASLIDTLDGHYVWSETYEFAVANVFDIQTDIAARIAGALEVTLAPRVFDGGTRNFEAYEAQMRAQDSKDIETTVLHLEEAIRLDPNFAEAYIDMARVYAGLGWQRYGHITPAEAWDKAEPYLTKAFEISTQLPGAYLVRGFLHQELGRYEDAERDFRQALEYDPNSALAYQLLGWLYRWNLNRYDEAVAMHERNVQVDPLDANAVGILGTSYWRAGRFEEAEAHYKRAIVLQPDHKEIYFSYAAMKANLGQVDESLRLAYTAASYEDAVSPRTIFNLALWYDLLGELDVARLLLEKVIENFPSNAPAHYELAEIYRKLDNRAAARQHATRALEIMGQYWPAIALLSWLDLETGEPAQALKRLHETNPELLEESPDLSNWRVYAAPTVARVLVANGDSARAEALLGAALAQDKDDYYLTARMHALLGERQAALASLQQGAASNPQPLYCHSLPEAPEFASLREIPAFQRLVEQSCDERDRQLARIARNQAQYNRYLPPDIAEIVTAGH